MNFFLFHAALLAFSSDAASSETSPFVLHLAQYLDGTERTFYSPPRPSGSELKKTLEIDDEKENLVQGDKIISEDSVGNDALSEASPSLLKINLQYLDGTERTFDSPPRPSLSELKKTLEIDDEKENLVQGDKIISEDSILELTGDFVNLTLVRLPPQIWVRMILDPDGEAPRAPPIFYRKVLRVKVKPTWTIKQLAQFADKKAKPLRFHKKLEIAPIKNEFEREFYAIRMGNQDGENRLSPSELPPIGELSEEMQIQDYPDCEDGMKTFWFRGRNRD